MLFNRNIMVIFKKICLVFCVCILVGLWGCQITENDKNQNTKSEDHDKNIGKVHSPSKEPIEFTALVADNTVQDLWGNDPVSQEIMERTGVKIKFISIQGNLAANLKVMFTGGNYPDLMLSIGNDVVAELAEKGALQPLDEFIDLYGHNIKKVFGQDLNKMKNELDGRIYGLNRGFKQISYDTDALFGIQYAVLKEAGYPELKTLDDLFHLIKNYMAKHPEINGLKTIGLTAWADSYGMNVSLCNPALRAAGFQNDGLYRVHYNGQFDVKYVLSTPEAQEYFRWLNKLHRNGLFDSSAVVQDRSLYLEKLSSGRVLVVTSESWDYSEAETKMRENGLPERCFAKFPLLFSEDTPSNISNYDLAGSWKSVITNKCKDPKRAFEFFDTMWSEEMQILCN